MNSADLKKITLDEHVKAGNLEPDVNYDFFLTVDGALVYQKWANDRERLIPLERFWSRDGGYRGHVASLPFHGRCFYAGTLRHPTRQVAPGARLVFNAGGPQVPANSLEYPPLKVRPAENKSE